MLAAAVAGSREMRAGLHSARCTRGADSDRDWDEDSRAPWRTRTKQPTTNNGGQARTGLPFALNKLCFSFNDDKEAH
eukprot:scaffold1999_cov153-Amphora_coffeaeformis.AAC.11